MTLSSLLPFNQIRSLKHRILLSALLSVFILLPTTGYIISNAYEKHMKASVEKELIAHAYAVLAVADIEQEKLKMPEVLLENQFNTFESGLYAFFTERQQPHKFLWQSASLLAEYVPKSLNYPERGESSYYVLRLFDKPHYVYSISVSFEFQNETLPITLHIAKQQDEIIALINVFKQQMWSSLAMLMGVLFLLQWLWLRWSLKPLSQLTQEISDIEQGKAEKLKKSYPTELEQVTKQLNTLLTTEQQQRARYRNALSDLAHSLKTPLAVIKGENKLPLIDQQVNMMTAMVEHQLTRAQSAANASWYLGVNIAECLKKLLPSLEKIYFDKNLSFDVDVNQALIFKGDESDLLEILGNLIDNACKAAKSRIIVNADITQGELVIKVADDGVGIKASEKQNIMERGMRADTYQKGYGIGLAIVRDIVMSYNGTISIERSEVLKGAEFILTFKAY